MFVFSRKKQHTKSTQQGFSLIELMVTITLVTLITGLLMAKYSSFNDVVLLKNQAYEIALDIREAQIFGVSARGENGTFKEAYGIYIEKDSQNYFLFQDTNNNLKLNICLYLI